MNGTDLCSIPGLRKEDIFQSFALFFIVTVISFVFLRLTVNYELSDGYHLAGLYFSTKSFLNLLFERILLY